MMTYRRTDTLEVVGVSDSDYAGCVDDKRSTYDYIFMMAKGDVSWKSVKQVTKDLMLTYRRTDTLAMVGFRDSDYAGCMDDKKSTFGYIFKMAEGVVSWKSVK